jgi:uncharacterized protein YecT (DUF1311 family)
MLIGTLPFILMMSLGMIVLAQAKPNCNDTASLTQRDLNICADQKAKAADAKLNQVYRQLRAKYKSDPAVEDTLITAQLAWIKFRDENCAFAQKRFERGSIAPLIYSSCLERVTTDRTKELERYLKGLESKDGL